MLKPLLLGLLVPALVCGAFIVAAARPRLDGGPARGQWGGLVGLTLGYLIAHVAVAGWPPLQPVDVTDWIPHAAVAAMVVGLIAWLWPRAVGLHWCLRFALAAGAVVVVTLPTMRHTWTTVQSVIVLLVLVPAMLATWISLDGLARRMSGPALALILLILSGAGSIALVVSKTAKLGQLCAALAAMAGAGLVVAWWNRRSSLGAGAAGVAAVLLGYLWLEGYLYAELPVASAILLAAAPSAAWVAALPAVRKLAPWQVACVLAAAVLMPTAAALVIAVVAGTGGDYYGY
ncbi:MAG: hypothetical protein ACYTGT_03025 [Planctomycetota bacterium]|jgi:hypothetical protein